MKTKHFIDKILLIVALLASFSGNVSNALANDFHPEFPLLDQQENKVIDSGNPLSTIKTCGACHDTTFIQAHSDHADAGDLQSGKSTTLHSWDTGPGYYGAWNAIDYDLSLKPDKVELDREAWLKRYGFRHIGGGPMADKVEMNCLLCHSNITDNEPRNAALAAGDFGWANSAPLIKIEALMQINNGWMWNAQSFNKDGSLIKGLLEIKKPQDENCAQCHGIVSNLLDEPLVLNEASLSGSMTLRTGQIISPQKVNLSGLNLENKDQQNYPFDVHSDRVLGCVSCHYSLNNPVYFQRIDENQPEHLLFDPRRLTVADYLQRPLHQLAKGNSSHGLASSQSENSLRRCESCHQAESIHQWLPYKTRHFAALACESCHIPKLYGPTLKSIDWSILDAQGEPLKQYRNSLGNPLKSNNILTAFEPILLPRNNVGGMKKLAPFNLVTSWYWTAGEPSRPVSRDRLLQALFKDGSAENHYKNDLIVKLDDNNDKQLTGSELRLDSLDKAEIVKTALQASGLKNISLKGEVAAYSISHNVVNGRWATKDCQSCHHKSSRVDAITALSDYRPGGVNPVVNNDPSLEFSGSVEIDKNGQVEFHADANKAGFYIIGRDGLPLVDLIGMMMFFGIALGVSGHAIARYISNRRRGATKHHYHREYIYDAYERLWHWMQAGSILILLITGLIIHKPHISSIFSFSYIVQVHNVVGFILLANAALSLFYNLASGEIRQYLPEPKGFIGRSIAQATYYSKGIFEGKPHPIEKTHDNKMNPLQQVTYLAILNILLPAQIITGLLIWGAQRWPELTQFFGGLPLLAPIHTLVAWSFAAFIVMHVYLTTTGHTPTAGIQAMIAGWDEVEDAPDSHESAR